MIDRRSFIKTVGGLSASMLPATASRSGQGPGVSRRKPNFLVVVADDQNFRTINALNNHEVHTPTFDRVVARGTTFTHCFHQGSWTGAVCIASRAMMHTGRYLWTCGGNTCGYYPLFGEVLQIAGYDTHIVGKWHNGDATALRSFATGRAIGPGMYISTPEDGLAYQRPRPDDPWTPWDPAYRGHWTPSALWDIEYSTPANPSRTGPGAEKAGAHYEAGQHSCSLYADRAVEFLRSRAARPDDPFLLYVAWNSPHDPRQAPKEIVDRYPADRIEVPPNFRPQHPFDQGDADVRDEELAPFPRTREAVQVHRREYYALLTYMDQQLGRILDALDQSGHADHTYIVVTGDHGLALGEHGLLGKQNLYDCSVRMPFIVIGPDVAAGRRIDALMYQHCLFPTLCDLAGLPTPATVQFPSLVPLLRGARSQLFDSIYCAYRGFQRMVRTDRYKLIAYPEARRVQLFDLTTDPWEMDDLAGGAAHAATVSELFRALRRWQGTVRDALVLDPAALAVRT